MDRERLKEVKSIGDARTNRMTIFQPVEKPQQELKKLIDKRDDEAIIGCLESQISSSSELFNVSITHHAFYITGYIVKSFYSECRAAVDCSK